MSPLLLKMFMSDDMSCVSDNYGFCSLLLIVAITFTDNYHARKLESEGKAILFVRIQGGKDTNSCSCQDSC